MIKGITDATGGELIRKVCTGSAFGCKISALSQAYGFDKYFVRFWSDEKEKMVIAVVDDQMIICGYIEKSEECKSFIKMTGVREIITSLKNAEKLGFCGKETGEVMRFRNRTDVADSRVKKESAPDIRSVHELLNEAGMIMEFEPFYLDLSHKVRHNIAHVYTYREGDVLAGVLIALVSRESVLISPVAVMPSHWRQGIGTRLVRRAQLDFMDKTIFLFKEGDRNNEFYDSLGAVRTDFWVRLREI